MRYTKTSCCLIALFSVLLFPAMPHAALEYYVVQFHLVDAEYAQNIGQKISLFSIYTGATFMGVCALAIMLLAIWMVHHIRFQRRHKDYRCW